MIPDTTVRFDIHTSSEVASHDALRLLAIDIDGTLVNSRDEITPATAAAIKAARAAGIEVVLATGRRYSRTLPLVEPLGVELPLVTASGALIKHPHDHRTLYCAKFRPEGLRGILRVMSDAGYDALLYSDSFAEGFDFYSPRLDVSSPELAEYLRMNPDCARVVPHLMTDPPADIFAGFAMGSRNEMAELCARLTAAWPDDVSVHVLRSPRYSGYMCEIAPAFVSKWSGILHLAELEGINSQGICAVGDDVNDIPMILGAGLGVAMGNALPEVKAAADRIAPCHDSEGLVEVVKWLME